MTHALEASGLSHRYGSVWALRDCSFALPAGRVCALVGPNGAGKTTLLQCATGLLEPTGGEVRVLGTRPAQDQDLLSRVGFVAQDAPLYRSFTVAEMLRVGARLNARWDADFARQRLERLEIPLDRRVAQLSGGQRAQVALAVATGKRPELLLLDEPLASLDPLARRTFLQGLMETVADAGVSVVVSSHLVTDLERVCDYLLILTDGRIRVAGDIERLLAEHKLLVGPRRAHVHGVAEVVEERSTARQTIAFVRVDGAIADPAWTVQDVTLEDLVLAYLGAREAAHQVTDVSRIAR